MASFLQARVARIAFQRGYWDKLSFLRQQGLPLPREWQDARGWRR